LSIDKTSRIPVYVQLMNIIIDQINKGILMENQQLPAERELCATYQLSRTTVRQAMQELEKDRYVYIQHGKGTFVSPKQYKQELYGFYSFTEEMKKMGKVPSTKIIHFEETQCDQRMARKMNCGIGEKIYHFSRLRYADDELVMLVTSNILCQRFPGFRREMLENNASLYEAFIDQYNVVFAKAKESLQSVGARKEEAKLLQIPVNFPCMLIERTTLENEIIIEYATSIARGDMFKYDIVLNK